MKKIRLILIVLLMPLLCGMGQAKASRDTVRILAIGNSFSQDAVEQYFSELCQADGRAVVIGNMYIGGCSIERHVNNARDNKADYAYRKISAEGVKVETRNVSLETALADEAWDYVSLQQASHFSGLYETYEQLLPELYDYVKARVGSKTKIMIHQTWAYQADSDHSGFANYDNDQMKMYTSVVSAYKKAAELVGIKMVIPSGTAIQNARTSFIGDRMTRDGYHLNLLYGRFTAACTWYEAIFGDVRDNDYAPAGVTADYAEVARLSAYYAVRKPYEVTQVNVDQLPVVYKDASAAIEDRVEDLLSRMTLEEKVLQLSQSVLGQNDNINNIGEISKRVPAGIGSFIYISDSPVLRNSMQKRAIEETRLGIPIIFGYDVIHGFRTVYPIPLAQAASWNPTLAGDACRVAAQESYWAGVDWTFSPMVDIAHDPRWGRIMEGYGEDPYLCSTFSAAAVKAYQGDDLAAENTIAACLKHYVGYGASEAGRDYVYSEISRQTLWDTYLPSFEAGVEAGAATLMSSFNNISGIPGSANHYTLTEILKDKWDFQGFVVSDWDAIVQLILQGYVPDRKGAAEAAINAGVEMCMVDNCYLDYLAELVQEGSVSMDRVDDAVRRVLRVKFQLGLFEHPYIEDKPESERILLPESLAVAEELAAETMVLLKNENNVLPLASGAKVALIGPMAKNAWQLLGSWAGRGRGEDVVDIYSGLTELAGEPLYAEGCDFEGNDTTSFAEAVSLASQADVVVLCLGERNQWSGENTSRSTIALPEIQEQLLAAVKRTGKPVVVLLSSGRSLDVTRIDPEADAVLEIWKPGVAGGRAVAGILTGKYNPSGKLPVTFPYTTGQIPIYYNRRLSGRRGTQGLYQDIPSTPMYEFGYGLSYTEFEYGPLTVTTSGGASCGVDGTVTISSDETLTASVTVKNVGSRDGKEVVQWYICDPFCSITRPVKELKHFEKEEIASGESRTFTFEIDPSEDLSFVNDKGESFLEDGDYHIMVGGQKVTVHVQ